MGEKRRGNNYVPPSHENVILWRLREQVQEQVIM
jgi:hypothetical protein